MKYSALAVLLFFSTIGCSRMPGKPGPGVEVPNPESITNFATLYGQNCAGCHGTNGKNGAAYNLSNPEYLSWVSDVSLKDIIANGEPGTQMPAFAKSAGGFLTDAQIDALVRGMRSNWQNTGVLNGTPAYTSTLAGDATHGQQVYQVACARCHNQSRQGITSSTYLALVNDQTLRTLIVAGRPDIGQPNWTQVMPGRPLTDQEVTDLVAWLASQRSQTPGQPYPHPQ